MLACQSNFGCSNYAVPYAAVVDFAQNFFGKIFWTNFLGARIQVASA
jgi:hypothetical protein